MVKFNTLLLALGAANANNAKLGMPVIKQQDQVAAASASASASSGSGASANANARAGLFTGFQNWMSGAGASAKNFKRGAMSKGASQKISGAGGDGTKQAKWLPWGAWNSCTGVCGNGVQTRLRRCLNGAAGIDCVGDTIDTQKCYDFTVDTCSYWSGWGAWSEPSATCNPARRCKTRTCYGRNTDHCEGPTECCEDVIWPERQNCTVESVILPAERCCHWQSNPHCGIKKTFQLCGECYPADQRRTLIAEEPHRLELCPNEEWTEWAVTGFECAKGRRRVETRQLITRVLVGNEVTVKVIRSADLNPTDATVKRVIPEPTQCSDYALQQGCNGAIATLLSGAAHQCPGVITNQRSCDCYSDVDQVDQFGKPLLLVQTLACGAPSVTETKVAILDRELQVTPIEFAGLTPDQCDSVCATECLERGLKHVTVRINACDGTEVVVAKKDCGRLGVWSDWALNATMPCPYPTCADDVYERSTYISYNDCSGMIKTEERVGEKCAYSACTPWSEWSVCDESFPAACEARNKERTRDCACPNNQLRQFTQCPVVPQPPCIVNEGPCLNADGQSCGAGLKEITTSCVCSATTVSQMACTVDEQFQPAVGPCECPREGEIFGREPRWKVSTNPSCLPAILTPSQDYWCNTYPQEWLDWTEWTSPSHKCANQCSQTRYRCKTCDGKSSAACAAKYTNAESIEVRRECGDEFISVSYSDCDGKCGWAGKRVKTTIDECRPGTPIPSTTEECFNPYTATPAVPENPIIIYAQNSPCCGGTHTQCYQPVMDGTTICEPRRCDPVLDIAPVRAPECDIISEWSVCSRAMDGTCAERRTIGDVCAPGAAPISESRDCTLGLGPWQWVGGNFGYGIEANCRFQSSDINMCDGYKVKEREILCKNDSPMNYLQSDLSETIPCGLIHQPNLVALTEATFYDNVPHYEPLVSSLWSSCGMGVNMVNYEKKNGKFMGYQTRIRRSLCATWPDVEISRECVVDCSTTPWGEWSGCSEDCGVGSEIRYRQCIHKSGLVLSAEYGEPQMRACGVAAVEVVRVSECLADSYCSNDAGIQAGCGAGKQVVTITLDHPNIDLPQCAALKEAGRSYTEPCNTGVVCPYWSAWSEPNMNACHQEPSCLTSMQKTRMCQGTSSVCNCQGPAVETVPCGPLQRIPLGPLKTTQATDCYQKCPGATYSTRQEYVCAPAEEQTNLDCPNLVDIAGPLTDWDRQCGECDTGYRSRTRLSICTGLPIEKYTEMEQCVPTKIPAYPQWSEWDRSACTECAAYQGAEMVRTASFNCPSLWPTQMQTSKCPMPVNVEVADDWRVCSQVCWKDETLMGVSTQLAGAAASADQCGSMSAAYAYSSITAYDDLNVVKDPNAWIDDGADLISRPGYGLGYRGGWTMRVVRNRCTGEEIRREYKQCGTCKCPHRMAHSATAVECMASTMTCPATAYATATATCDESLLALPECAHIASHPYFLGLCRDAAVQVTCTANARRSEWGLYGTCTGPNGQTCAEYEGQMGTQFRTRYEGCGATCQQVSEARECVLPYTPPQISLTAWTETYCALGTGLGEMEQIVTTTNTCTGAISTSRNVRGSNDIPNRQTRRLVKTCNNTEKCGAQKGFVEREEYEVTDRCLLTKSVEIGNTCKYTICPYFGAWQTWEACSTSCDLGVKKRIRYCIGGVVGEGYCRPNEDGVTTEQVAPCNEDKKCCDWDWSGWTGCCFNSQKSTAVRYRFRRNCGADSMTGKETDCSSNFELNSDPTKTPSCESIDSNYNSWILFHNPDKSRFTGHEQIGYGLIRDVDAASDSVFAYVSRSYAVAATRSYAYAGAYASTAPATSLVSYQPYTVGSGSFLPEMGTAQVNAGAIAPSVYTPMLGQPIGGASAAASASSNAVASAAASAAASSSVSAAAGASASSGNMSVGSPAVGTMVGSGMAGHSSSGSAASASASAAASTGSTATQSVNPYSNFFNTNFLWG